MLSLLLIADEDEVVRHGVRTQFTNDDSVEFCGEAHNGMNAIRVAPRLKEPSLEKGYDLFEQYPNGSSLWRGSVSGFENACLRLQELTEKSEYQFYAISLTPGEVLIFDLELQHCGLVTPLKVERLIKSQVA